jgi:riboflavin synthase
MFTGLVEALGTIRRLSFEGAGCRLCVAAPMMANLTLGESVAVNGACLSVVEHDGEAGSFQVGPETLAKTNLGSLQIGDRVNLERSLRVGDRLGGHMVQGHVDGVGSISKKIEEGEWQTVWFQCPPALAMDMVPKGSVAVDGISLTVVEVTRDAFSVALIPQTLANTTLGFKQTGAPVNLETDILAKYVRKCLDTQPPRSES